MVTDEEEQEPAHRKSDEAGSQEGDAEGVGSKRYNEEPEDEGVKQRKRQKERRHPRRSWEDSKQVPV